MKKPSLQEIVLKHTLPNPKSNDPTTFFGHVQRNLVPEVRHEVHLFYGSLDCLEAQYPGLDYTYAPHRRRLSRYPWHRRLFRTFDELKLTAHEITSLCQWEGTRSAKERYEAETKKKIVDTTADDIVSGPVSEGPRCKFFDWIVPSNYNSLDNVLQSGPADIETESEQSNEDEMNCTVGVQVNQQLQTAVNARLPGDDLTVDAQWEQWMKEAMERNEYDRDSVLQAIREGHLLSQISNNLNNIVVDQERSSRRFEDLRSMLSELQSANNQLAADNAQLARILSRSQPETAR